ncbi:protein SEC13 homolog isoform X2 [Tachypleus tridentatus]|uniref:protein SEC13 homolog isoform X2 n=1 Tax=Tachypleus tridentatus TaxID=6853 RepID=UPI003FD4CF7B
MVSLEQTVDTSHEDMIHDAQMDYYGIRLATCSSDQSVKIFDVKNGTHKLVADLREVPYIHREKRRLKFHWQVAAENKIHEGPVWQVAWAHPMFGNILASCSYDRKVVLWKETRGEWKNIYVHIGHDSSVNSLCWAPHDLGLMLACGSSDGAVSILSSSGDGNWDTKKINNAHTIGCNAVSWAPALALGLPIYQPLDQKPQLMKRFVTGGCDNLVKIWKYVDEEDQWVEEQKLEAHSDWVRDVAWAPSIGLPHSIIASCSQDRRVIIWKNDGTNSTWNYKVLHTFDDVVWHASWSVTGNVLAVSGGDNKVSLWKETPDGQWVCISNNHPQGQVTKTTVSSERTL